MKQASGGTWTTGNETTSGPKASASVLSQAAQTNSMPKVSLSKRPAPTPGATAPGPTTAANASSDIDPPLDLNARLGLQTPAEASALTPSPQSTATDTKTSEAQEILRLLRDPQTGQLVVVVAGERYRRLSEVTDKTSGELILQVVAHLLRFTNGMIFARDGLKSLVVPAVKPLSPLPASPEAPLTISRSASLSQSATPPASQPPVTEPALFPPQPIATGNRLSQQGHTQPSGQAEPAPQRLSFLGRFGSKQADSPEIPMGLNLAEEINEIVQRRLAASPLAATTRIAVEAEPAGGIRIDVNGTVYRTPDEIADPEVKALVKSSIQAWEKS